MAERIPLEGMPLAPPQEDAEASAQQAALWQALEGERRIPPVETLGALSGLLGDDVARASTALALLTPDVRRELVRTLSEAAGSDFSMDFSAIFRISLDDADGEVRAAAVTGLSETDDARLVRAFARILRQDPVEAVRAAAADGLGKYVLLGELEKVRPTPFHTAATALRACHLDEAEPVRVRSKALRAISYTEEHGVRDLIASAYEAAEEEMRTSAVAAMGHSANDAWRAIVKQELVSANPDMRLEATRACGEIQLADTVEDIAMLADDVDQRIRLAAVWALGQIGGQAARKALQTYTSAEDEEIRAAADEALQELDFFSGDLTEFFGPGGATDEPEDALWNLPGYVGQDDE